MVSRYLLSPLMHSTELLNLTSVCALEQREAANIKRLEKMRRMRRHAESDDLVLGAVLVELWRSVAAVAD